MVPAGTLLMDLEILIEFWSAGVALYSFTGEFMCYLVHTVKYRVGTLAPRWSGISGIYIDPIDNLN